MKGHTVTKSTYPPDHTASTLSLAEAFPLSRVPSALLCMLNPPPLRAHSATLPPEDFPDSLSPRGVEDTLLLSVLFELIPASQNLHHVLA